jgi:hypothetical protein
MEKFPIHFWLLYYFIFVKLSLNQLAIIFIERSMFATKIVF